jgi:hypothetical protein
VPIQFRPSGGKIPSNIALPGAKFLGNFQRKSLGTRLGSTELVRVDSEVDLGITVPKLYPRQIKCWVYYGERAPC